MTSTRRGRAFGRTLWVGCAVLAGCARLHRAPVAPTPSPAPPPEAPSFRAQCTERWIAPGVPGTLAKEQKRALKALGIPVHAARSRDSTGIRVVTDPVPFPRRFSDGGAGRFSLAVELTPARSGQADSTAMSLEVRVGPVADRWILPTDSAAAHHAAEGLCVAALRATKVLRAAKRVDN